MSSLFFGQGMEQLISFPDIRYLVSKLIRVVSDWHFNLWFLFCWNIFVLTILYLCLTLRGSRLLLILGHHLSVIGHVFGLKL